MPERSSYLLRTLRDKDKTEVTRLLNDTFSTGSEFWAWKYESNPEFNPVFARVATKKGKVVGCAFWLPRTLKISDSITVRAALGADLAVDAEHKGHGIGTALIASENEVLEDKKVIMSYGFVPAELVEHIHGPQIGLIGISTSTIVCRKYLDHSEINRRVRLINKLLDSNENLHAKHADVRIKTLFRLRGQQPFAIRLGPDRVILEEDLRSPDVKVECDLTRLDLFRSRMKTLTVIKALLTRKIRIRGSPLKILRLLPVWKLIKILVT